METPAYIKTLLTPNGNKPSGRRVWSIPLESVLIPFFTATNLQGDTAIPVDALGAPLRLSYGQDGAVKFSKTGRPVIKVAKPIADHVKMMRENFIANLGDYTESVIQANPKGFEALQRNAVKAGKPITTADHQNLQRAIAEAQAKAMEDATKPPETTAETPAEKEPVPA